MGVHLQAIAAGLVTAPVADSVFFLLFVKGSYQQLLTGLVERIAIGDLIGMALVDLLAGK